MCLIQCSTVKNVIIEKIRREMTPLNGFGKEFRCKICFTYK